MENYKRVGDFVIKTPKNINTEFYESVMLDEYGRMIEPALCMNVACIQDKILFRGVTEEEYYYLADKLYAFGTKHKVPAEDMLLVISPDWYGRPRTDAPSTDMMQRWIGAESSEKQRDFYLEDAFPDPVKLLFEGTERECIVTRALKALKCGGREPQTQSKIKGTFFEDKIEGFVRSLYSYPVQKGDGKIEMEFRPKKKLHINGTLSLASDESHATKVSFTGSYKKALKLFSGVLIDRARYNLDKK